MDINATVVGADQLLAKLQNLAKNKAKQAIRRGSKAAAKIIAAEAKKTAPKLTGELQANIKVRSLPRSRRYVGSTVKEVYKVAGFLEFGTKHAEGNHNIEQSYERVKRQATTAFLDTMKAEIEAP